jgi:hypothetical protein
LNLTDPDPDTTIRNFPENTSRTTKKPQPQAKTVELTSQKNPTLTLTLDEGFVAEKKLGVVGLPKERVGKV